MHLSLLVESRKSISLSFQNFKETQCVVLLLTLIIHVASFQDPCWPPFVEIEFQSPLKHLTATHMLDLLPTPGMSGLDSR